MLTVLRNFSDRILGRGDAAITVPVMDGALKPNRVLDEAELVCELPAIDDLASNDNTLWATAGATLYRLDRDNLTEVHRFDAEITALAVNRDGLVAVALAGSQIRVIQFEANGREFRDIARMDSLGERNPRCINALAFDGPDQLLLTDGSDKHGPREWCYDLMELGRSGRVGRWNFRTGDRLVLAEGLQYAYGVLAQAGGILFSESWKHRVVGMSGNGDRKPCQEMPSYSSRMAPSASGGFWLSCFVCRTQLVEFVLSETAFRKRMIAEIDQRYWIAPALSSGKSFLEPLQGAGVKQMGVLKPWAPPRSYGLVLRISAEGHVVSSMHSQVDGRHHGITAVTEHKGSLYVASKGSDRLLRVNLQSKGVQP